MHFILQIMATTTGKVIYDSLEEYRSLRSEFEANLPQLIREKRIDDWTHSNPGYTVKYGIQFSNRFEDALLPALAKLTKDQIPEWAESTADMLSCAIRGIAKSVSKMDGLRHSVATCSDCGQEDVIEMQEGFEAPEICNVMCVGLINNVLFDTEAEDVGSEEWGMMRKVRLFKCPGCEQLEDEFWSDGGWCLSCNRESE